MFSWAVRVFLIIVSAIAEWFIALDSPRFQLVQIGLSLLPVMLILFAAAFWPARWSEYLGRTFRKSR